EDGRDVSVRQQQDGGRPEDADRADQDVDDLLAGEELEPSQAQAVHARAAPAPDPTYRPGGEQREGLEEQEKDEGSGEGQAGAERELFQDRARLTGPDCRGQGVGALRTEERSRRAGGIRVLV